MDGWESRRRRTPGFDWCVIRLGLPGRIGGVVVDTSFFRGNYPEQCSLEACAVEGQPTVERLTDESNRWTKILARSPLAGDSQNPFDVKNDGRFTHLRFRIYPDGGVARLRVYGEVAPDWVRIYGRGGEVDLAAVEHGGLVLACSDMFFGHRHNLIMPGRAADMSDGWETKRRRGPGHDWAVVKLGARARAVKRVEVDTAHFKGNSGRGPRGRRRLVFGRLAQGAAAHEATGAHAPPLRGRDQGRAGDAPALQHLPGRRREPAARLLRAGR
jgi:allantoicase